MHPLCGALVNIYSCVEFIFQLVKDHGQFKKNGSEGNGDPSATTRKPPKKEEVKAFKQMNKDLLMDFHG